MRNLCGARPPISFAALIATPLQILWRDEYLAAIFKPAGWLVHRAGLGAGKTRFVMQALGSQLGRHVYPVHRLDKGTCEVLVMALHSAAARVLSVAFEQRVTNIRYLATGRGWAPDASEVNHALKPDDAPWMPPRASKGMAARLATDPAAPRNGHHHDL